MYQCVRLGAAPRRRSAYDIKVPRERFEKHAEPSLYIDQWEPSVLCSSRGALMSYSDRSACAVALH